MGTRGRGAISGAASRGRGPHLEGRECGGEPIEERGFGVAIVGE